MGRVPCPGTPARYELRDRGIGDISPPEAFAAWELASQYGEPNLVIMVAS